MINGLIKDLAFDQITLSQALNRSKLIAHQIKNDVFSNWLNKELIGYEHNDPLLPGYRKIWAEIELTAEFPFGREQTFPVVMNENQKEIEDSLNFYHVIEPIAIIEQNIVQMTEAKGGRIYLTGAQLQIVGKIYEAQIASYGGVIRCGYRTIGKAKFLNIIELTKQKLIDTLQDLEEQFPEIDEKYIMNEENDKKVQNIITNNIYGNNNPMNVVVGENITQEGTVLSINQADIDKLKEFGIQDDELNELVTIDQEIPKKSPERKNKIMDWLGKVIASLTARGIYDSIPNLVQYINTVI
jgi:hypothetical protein